MEIWLILPAFNEGANLSPLLEGIAATIGAAGIPYGVIVVDDGSTDDTRAVAGALGEHLPVQVVAHPHERHGACGRSLPGERHGCRRDHGCGQPSPAGPDSPHGGGDPARCRSCHRLPLRPGRGGGRGPPAAPCAQPRPRRVDAPSVRIARRAGLLLRLSSVPGPVAACGHETLRRPANRKPRIHRDGRTAAQTAAVPSARRRGAPAPTVRPQAGRQQDAGAPDCGRVPEPTVHPAARAHLRGGGEPPVTNAGARRDGRPDVTTPPRDQEQARPRGRFTLPATSRHDLVAVLALAGLTTVFFGRVLFTEQALYWGDLLLTFYPAHDLWKRSILEGHLPLWNPYVFNGLPLLADAEYSPLYPSMLLNLILPLHRALALDLALHVFLLGAFTYSFLRQKGLPVGPSFLGAVTWAFSGFVAVRLTQPSLLRPPAR